MENTEKDVEGKKQMNISDSIPSSSTDADVKPQNSDSTNEDDISSTSAEPEASKTMYSDVNQFTDGLSPTDINLIIMGQPLPATDKKPSPSTADSDFLELNMSGMLTENITEDVEDIVQDLENLLGESTDSFTIPAKSKKTDSAAKEQTSHSSTSGAASVDPFTIFENQLAEQEKLRQQRSSSEGNEAISSINEKPAKNQESESAGNQAESDIIGECKVGIETNMKSVEPERSDFEVTSVKAGESCESSNMMVVESDVDQIACASDDTVTQSEMDQSKNTDGNEGVKSVCDDIESTSIYKNESIEILLEQKTESLSDLEPNPVITSDARSEENVATEPCNANQDDFVTDRSENEDNKESTENTDLAPAVDLTDNSKDGESTAIIQITTKELPNADLNVGQVNVTDSNVDQDEVENEQNIIELTHNNKEVIKNADLVSSEDVDLVSSENVGVLSSMDLDFTTSNAEEVDDNNRETDLAFEEENVNKSPCKDENEDFNVVSSGGVEAASIDVDLGIDTAEVIKNEENVTPITPTKEVENEADLNLLVSSESADATTVDENLPIIDDDDDNEIKHAEEDALKTDSSDNADVTSMEIDSLTDCVVKELEKIEDPNVVSSQEISDLGNNEIDLDYFVNEPENIEDLNSVLQENVETEPMEVDSAVENIQTADNETVSGDRDVEDENLITEVEGNYQVKSDFNTEVSLCEEMNVSFDAIDTNVAVNTATLCQETIDSVDVDVNAPLASENASFAIEVDCNTPVSSGFAFAKTSGEVDENVEIPTPSTSINQLEISSNQDLLKDSKIDDEAPINAVQYLEHQHEESQLASQISEINSIDDESKTNDDVSMSAEQVFATADDKPSENEIPDDEDFNNQQEPVVEENLQDRLTLEAVQSIANYEFEENFISSSDGGAGYSNAVQEPSPYEAQENVPVSSSENNYTESTPSSSFRETIEVAPNAAAEEEDEEEEKVTSADPVVEEFHNQNQHVSSPQVESSVDEAVTSMEIENEISADVIESLPENNDVKTPLRISVDSNETVSESTTTTDEAAYKSDVEKEDNRGPLKMTITKQADSTHSILKIFNPGDSQCADNIEVESKPIEQSVPKLIIRPVPKPIDSDQPSVPKITIKPIQQPSECSIMKLPESNVDANNPLKMTIRSPGKSEQNVSPKLIIKHKSDGHEIGHHSPRITIKPILRSPEETEQVHTPRLTIKPILKPTEDGEHEQTHSPRLTIKPIVKPHDETKSVDSEHVHSPRLTIKPIVKPHEDTKSADLEQTHSPRLTIKPIVKPPDESKRSTDQHSPRITIKPLVKPTSKLDDASEVAHSPKITIKPVVRPDEIEITSTPKITIKPVVRPDGNQPSRMTIKRSSKQANPVEIIEIKDDMEMGEKLERVTSPKITIKPIVKPADIETIDLVDYEEEIKQERIVLKINKNTIPSSKECGKKRELPEDSGNEKLAKIKLKFSKEGRRAHIVTPRSAILKRPAASRDSREEEAAQHKRSKVDQSGSPQAGKEQLQSKLKQILSSAFMGHISGEQNPSEFQVTKDNPATTIGGMEISVVSRPGDDDVKDPLGDIPVFEISPATVETVGKSTVVDLTDSTSEAGSEQTAVVVAPVVPPPPRKRGRPRKVPLVVREEFKDPKEESVPPPQPQLQEHYDSGRPKRSCRGPSVRMTLGIKPRKPRGPGRGRGGKRGMGTRTIPMKPAKEPKLSAAKLKLLKALKDTEKEVEVKDVIEIKSPEKSDVVIYEEETRMSADSSSRAQTPAKQVISSAVEVEESQSSVQSSATTESVKVRRGPRLEVHQEPEGAVISAEQLAEYSWGGGGPYMLQEQVAQFLGIKSFKRKYPGIKRRPVDMQERDFIRESGLASEAMCDLGLTAVNSTDILDIMYSDFQNKYEEYCKHQRDRQAKDLTNKQKALSLAAKQESNKLDITEQAIQSAASWNCTFNKARRDERRACLDLQTFTVQYPKGKMKQINKDKVGNYPVALVPGQFTDWYKNFTPTELNNLPLNTMCYDAININNNIVPQDMDDSQSDCSMSDSDSSSSDSDSSDSGSSDDCNMCSPPPPPRRVPMAT